MWPSAPPSGLSFSTCEGSVSALRTVQDVRNISAGALSRPACAFAENFTRAGVRATLCPGIAAARSSISPETSSASVHSFWTGTAETYKFLHFGFRNPQAESFIRMIKSHLCAATAARNSCSPKSRQRTLLTVKRAARRIKRGDRIIREITGDGSHSFVSSAFLGRPRGRKVGSDCLKAVSQLCS